MAIYQSMQNMYVYQYTTIYQQCIMLFQTHSCQLSLLMSRACTLQLPGPPCLLLPGALGTAISDFSGQFGPEGINGKGKVS